MRLTQEMTVLQDLIPTYSDILRSTLTRTNRIEMPQLKLNIPCSLPPMSKAILTFFNIGYYMFLHPVKYQYDEVSGNVRAVPRSTTFMVMRVLMLIIGQILTVGPILIHIPSQLNHLNVVTLTMEYLAELGWWLINTAITLEIWLTTEYTAEVVRALISLEKKLGKYEPKSKCLVFFKYPIVLAFSLHIIATVVNIWEFETFYPRDDNLVFFNFIPTLEGATINNILLCILEYTALMTHFGTMRVLILSLTFLVLAQNINAYFEKEPPFTKMMQTWRQVARISVFLKKCIGFSVLGICFFVLPYYTINIQKMFTASGLLAQFQSYYYTSQLFLILLMGAYIHAQFHRFMSNPNTLAKAESRSYVDEALESRKKMLLVHIVDCGNCGIRGGGLTLTFNFCANIAGTILAYSIAIIQLEALENH